MDKVNMSVAIIPMAKDFGWNSSIAGLVQSSFFWGYLLCQLPGGFITQRFGGKTVMPLGVGTWSLATCFVPVLAGTIPGLCFSRAAVGLGEGVAPSAAVDMVAKMMPASERSRSISFIFNGLNVGSFVGLLLAPYIIKNLGWESVFVLFGVAGMAWTVWFSTMVEKIDVGKLMQEVSDQNAANTTGS